MKLDLRACRFLFVLIDFRNGKGGLPVFFFFQSLYNMAADGS
jgi:hypothetical protein